MSPWEQHCGHLLLPFAPEKACFAYKLCAVQSKTQTAPFPCLPWELSTAYLDMVFILSVWILILLNTLLGAVPFQTTKCLWWLLVESNILRHVGFMVSDTILLISLGVLLIPTNRLLNPLYTLFKSASCCGIVKINSNKQLCMKWTKLISLQNLSLSETSHVIHPTRLGAVVFNLTNILIELNIAISLCYTSVASLESIS